MNTKNFESKLSEVNIFVFRNNIEFIWVVLKHSLFMKQNYRAWIAEDIESYVTHQVAPLENCS